MKKQLTALIAAALLTLSANSSFAAISFADSTLFRVIYDSTGIQQLANLGSVNSLLSGGTSTITPGTFSAVNPAALSVSYFALDRATAALWVSGIAAPTATAGGFTGLTNASGVDNNIVQMLATAVSGSTGSSLASLANGSASSVSQTLYYINDANSAGVAGIGKATITTSATTTQIVPTPLPSAILLLGSGLLGLAGGRRRCSDSEIS
ncbi:MAG TPA: hypothetical protein HPP97_13420 [Desulfuromonadales bacterium]|nr:hypothetical protein [Desulfuromonadales bacterium]